MRNAIKTRLAIFILLSAACIYSLMMTTPTSRGYACTSCTCNAVNAGSTYNYYGEEDQSVLFEADFDASITSGTKFNVSYNGGSWVEYSPTIVGSHCSYTHMLENSLVGSNVTASFKFSDLSNGPEYTTPVIIINIAEALDPANATDVTLALRPAGQVRITWAAGLKEYVGKGWASDNAELNHWEIYYSPIVIDSKGAYGALTPVADDIAPTTFQCTVTLPSDMKYYFAVIARDRAGHGSEPSAQKFTTPDRTIPSLSKYEMNGTSYNATGSRMNVPTGGIMKFKLTLSEGYLTGYIVLKTISNGYPFQKPYMFTYNNTGGFYWVNVETTPAGSEELKLGTYDVILNFTDAAGNNFLKEYTGQLSIYEPNPVLDAFLIIAPIAAVAIVAGYVAQKKLKQRRLADMQQVDTKGGPRRKGQIYRGASDLGRASGDEAEEILSKRRRDAGGSQVKRKEKARGQESRSAPATAPSLSSAAPSSAAEIREKAEKFDTLSASAGVKEIRAVEKAQTIDPGKKVGFLEGRVTNLENVMSIAVNLVEMIPEAAPCDKCGKPLNPSWSSCPWCLTSAQSDELEMKLAISGIDGKKANFCPTCRAPMLPGWVKCPYCATRKV